MKRYAKGVSKSWIVHGKNYMKTNRMIIYPKDVQRITGKSNRYGRQLLNRIKVQFGKAPHQFVSVEEFCRYTGLAPEQVILYIND
ncbi:MAG: hypothetical protein AB7S48_15250 [Bacteroidales bacterium]